MGHIFPGTGHERECKWEVGERLREVPKTTSVFRSGEKDAEREKSSSQGEKPRLVPCRRERPAVPTLAGCSSIQASRRSSRTGQRRYGS